MDYPSQVKIVEVGARDGLQNEKQSIPAATKIEFINRLSDSGLTTVEATSFVNPKWIPQLADAAEVYAGINKKPGVHYPVLVPNEKGMQRALECGVKEIAVFTAASESFNRKNINASIAESIERFAPVMELAKKYAIPVRGYVSCVLGCPYEGDIAPQKVADVAQALEHLGCYEISLGDTIGTGTPKRAQAMLETVARQVPMNRLAIHFHDTYGQALANIHACLALGVATVDASVSGLGGCPYAKGATGNVATEDVVYMLHGMGIETGVDLGCLLDAGHYISNALDRAPASKVGSIPRDSIRGPFQ